MKAQAKGQFQVYVRGREVLINKGQVLDVVLDKDNNDESGEIRLGPDYICDMHSPFANTHFFILDESDLAAQPPNETNQERLTRIKKNGIASSTPSDMDWLLHRAEKTEKHEEWLEKIAEMSPTEHSAADAAYWALLALGRV